MLKIVNITIKLRNTQWCTFSVLSYRFNTSHALSDVRRAENSDDIVGFNETYDNIYIIQRQYKFATNIFEKVIRVNKDFNAFYNFW